MRNKNDYKTDLKSELILEDLHDKIELLAVIVILSIIAAITIPKISETIDSSRESSSEDSFYGSLQSAEIAWVKGSNVDQSLSTVKCTYLEGKRVVCTGDDVKLETSGILASSGTITITNGTPIVYAEDSLNFNNHYCCGTTSQVYCKKKSRPTVSESKDICKSSGITAISMLKAKATENGDGLYADTDEDDKYNDRYIYKGKAPDNYITFNGEKAGWRILSVEPNLSIKIIKNGSIGNYYWDENGSNIWSNATIKTYLNGEYFQNLVDKQHVLENEFSVGGVIGGNQDLLAQIRSENATKWNSYVGLMTVSEYLKANTNMSQCGNMDLNNDNYNTCYDTNWIFWALRSHSWTINKFVGTDVDVNFIRMDNRTAEEETNKAQYAIAPVVYLKPGIDLTGSGTEIDPYEIK